MIAYTPAEIHLIPNFFCTSVPTYRKYFQTGVDYYPCSLTVCLYEPYIIQSSFLYTFINFIENIKVICACSLKQEWQV